MMRGGRRNSLNVDQLMLLYNNVAAKRHFLGIKGSAGVLAELALCPATHSRLYLPPVANPSRAANTSSAADHGGTLPHPFRSAAPATRRPRRARPRACAPRSNSGGPPA